MRNIVEKLHIHKLVFRNPREEIVCFVEKIITIINMKILQTLPEERQLYEKKNVISNVY